MDISSWLTFFCRFLVAGGIGNAVLLGIEAALEKYFLNSTNTSGVQAAVAIYFLIAFWYTCTIECTGYVYGCEIWPTHLRSKGATISYASFYVTSIWATAPAAVAFSTIGWRYYMVFIAVSIPLVVAIWLLCPEVSLNMTEIGVSADRSFLFVCRRQDSRSRRSEPSSATRWRLNLMMPLKKRPLKSTTIRFITLRSPSGT